MKKIFEGKDSMFKKQFCIYANDSKADSEEFWIRNEGVSADDAVSIPINKETAYAMAKAIINEVESEVE